MYDTPEDVRTSADYPQTFAVHIVTDHPDAEMVIVEAMRDLNVILTGSRAARFAVDMEVYRSADMDSMPIWSSDRA